MSILKKKAQAILVPTAQKSNIFKHIKNWKGETIYDAKLEYSNNATYINNIHLINSGKAATNVQDKYEFFHLHIVIDERPKPDEWFIMNGCILRKCNHIKVQGGIETIVDTVEGEHHNSVCKKVITTINTELLKPYREQTLNGIAILPQPSDSFIKRYIEAFNQGAAIVDVMIDYQSEYFDEKGNPFGESYIKVDKNNTITITRCKESYTRQEVDKLLDSFAERFVANTDMAYKQKDIADWKTQNL